jgi:hypothetical protein
MARASLNEHVARLEMDICPVEFHVDLAPGGVVTGEFAMP